MFSTLSVWLREAGVSRETIGFASWISLAYAFKWVWSPLLDQWRLPLLGRLGRRRSWLALSQLMVAVGLAVIGAMKSTGWVDVDWNAVEAQVSQTVQWLYGEAQGVKLGFPNNDP